MTDKEYKEYREFMYDKKNIRNCRECPENNGERDLEGLRLPCGQYNCWVAVHCYDVYRNV